ncbi:unnamed protein product, partial [Amoebophrya sp. A120]
PEQHRLFTVLPQRYCEKDNINFDCNHGALEKNDAIVLLTKRDRDACTCGQQKIETGVQKQICWFYFPQIKIIFPPRKAVREKKETQLSKRILCHLTLQKRKLQ